MFEKGKSSGIHTRRISNHGFVHSIYFRDPNGYVVELSAPVGDDSPESKAETRAKGRTALAGWTVRKSAT